MKHYLLIPFLFLTVVLYPFFSFCFENPDTPSSQSTSSPAHLFDENTEAHQEPKSNSHPHEFHHELHEGWPDVFESKGGGDSFQSKFFNMLFILFLLIGFMILASWALKRMMKTKVTQLNSASSIKVLETRTLSPRATLYLIEVQGKSFLIAESPSHVTHLAALEEDL